MLQGLAARWFLIMIVTVILIQKEPDQAEYDYDEER
jgi:hypothetical protein